MTAKQCTQFQFLYRKYNNNNFNVLRLFTNQCTQTSSTQFPTSNTDRCYKITSCMAYELQMSALHSRCAQVDTHVWHATSQLSHKSLILSLRAINFAFTFRPNDKTRAKTSAAHNESCTKNVRATTNAKKVEN